MSVQSVAAREASPRLVRSLTLTHAVLYGLGVTIGAGIYVLVGLAAGRSGMHAPLAFMGAALVMAFSAATSAMLVPKVACLGERQRGGLRACSVPA